MGTGLWSGLLRDLNQRDKRFSHIGIVLGGPDGKWQVVHADADDQSLNGGVTVISMEEFKAASTSWAVYRHPSISALQSSGIAEAARSLIGTEFDARFDLDDPTELYCSELAFRAYLAAGSNLIRPSNVDGRKFVSIDDCYLGAECIDNMCTD